MFLPEKWKDEKYARYREHHFRSISQVNVYNVQENADRAILLATVISMCHAKKIG